ncbi:hypothetical protein Tco_0348359 [Tanacetum coccineum]
MYLNLWSYKAVRHRYSNPMIQPKPEGSTQGYPLDSVEVLRYDTKGEKVRIRNNATKRELTLDITHKGVVNELVSGVDPHRLEGYLKMVVKLKYMFQDFRYSDTVRLSRSDEVLKLKNFKKDATLKLFKLTIKKGMSRSVAEGVSRSVPEGVSRSVPEGMSRSVPEGMSRSVPEGMSRSVPEGISRSVHKEISRSVPS